MAKGQKTKAGHIIQMIHHGADPNRFNPNGKRVVCHNAEDYDFIEGIEFDKLSRKGAKALIANVPLAEMWTGKISGPLHYNLMDDQIFPFWIAKGVETPINVGGVPCIDTEYVRPQLDRADRAFFAIEEGKAGGGADLGCYGMFTSFKWTSKRGNKGKSRFEVGFATQAAVPRPNLTGGTAQNHKTRITAANVAGALGLSVVASGVAAKALSISIGDDATAIKAKFTAQGLTVNATGGVALGAGETHRVAGEGNALSIYGGINVFDKTITTLQTAIRALPGRASAVVAGTITQAAAATGYRVSGAGTSAANRDYIKSGAMYIVGGSSDLRLEYENGVWSLSDAGLGQLLYSANGTASAPPLNGWTKARDGAVPAPTLSAIGGTPASASLTITYDAAAGNVADIEAVPGAGYVGTSTQPGAAGGVIELEFTNPGNALVNVNKASGDAGYVISTPQYGSDGSILQSMLPDDPIMPGHLFLYSADTPLGLEDEANLVGQIEEWEIDDPKICLLVSHHVRVNDPERPTLPATYNAHAEEESQEDGIKLSVTMDADEGGIVDGMKALLRASGSRLVSVPRYWRIAAIHPGSPRRVFIDFYGSVGASVPVKWAGSVEQYTFVYDLLENKTAPWNFKAKTRRPA